MNPATGIIIALAAVGILVAVILLRRNARPKEGEVLYKGQADFPQASQFEASFVLTADGREIRAVNVKISGLRLPTNANFCGANVSGGSVKASVNHAGRHPVQNGVARVNMGSSGWMDLTLGGGKAVGSVTYTYVKENAYLQNGFSRDLRFSLGTAPISFEAQAGG